LELLSSRRKELGLTATSPMIPWKQLDRDWHVGLARVLGHVMAHELGHLLLGSNAHSRQGIMCPNWHAGELRLASMGGLLFSEEQGRFMREGAVR
jgi:hypothetical protein